MNGIHRKKLSYIYETRVYNSKKMVDNNNVLLYTG